MENLQGILPPDKPQTPVLEPHNFFLYGAPMAGKSYFASFFPHPLSLNTDGNAEQSSTPAIQIRNTLNPDGSLKQNAISQLSSIILALNQPNVTFKTVIVDVIDDICVMMEQAICREYGAQCLADIPYGKGYALLNSTLQEFVLELKALPIDVIFVSRELDKTDEKTARTSYIPSLKTKYYDIVTGNCDAVIRFSKIGNEYIRQVTQKRADYKQESIKDERVRKLLSSCAGMFTD